MFMFSGYPASVLRWRQGPVISGFLTFMDRYRDEAACIAALAELRWPNGFICAGCVGRLAYQLAARPRVFECADWRAAAFGDRRDGLAPHPHAVAQMVRGGMADRARQARRFGSIPGARTGAALRHGLADGAQVAPRAERAAGIPARRPD